MRHVLSFLAGLMGVFIGLIAVHVVVWAGLVPPELFASRITVVVALLPACVGYLVVDRGGDAVERRRRVARLDGQHRPLSVL